jgi:hypothetical protein
MTPEPIAHRLGDWAVTSKRQAPALHLQHVLVPRLKPTAMDHVTLNRGAVGNQRCESAAIANAEEKNCIVIDECVAA